MMNKNLIKSVLLLSLVLSFFTGSAENYLTKQEINVRSGPGTSYSVKGIIPVDSTIDVQEINGNWATIQYNAQPAYISTKFISKPIAAEHNVGAAKNKSNGSNTSMIFYIIGGIGVILIIKFVTSRVSELLGLSGEEAFKYRCTNCGRYSTRRGHVYKCNDGAHDWFKL